MKKIEASILLERIISKGGLYGSAAKMYAGDKEKTEQFILECSEQCHNRSAVNQWGEDLVEEIKTFREKLIISSDLA